MAKPPTIRDATKAAAATEGFARRERSCAEKIAYTHNEAIRARTGIAKSRRHRRMRIYACRFCGLYHLTRA